METGKCLGVIYWERARESDRNVKRCRIWRFSTPPPPPLIFSDVFLALFRFRMRLGQDFVNSRSWLQRNTNPGQYWPTLCEQELISCLGLTLTRVCELSMWQFTSWSKPLAHWFRSQIPTLTLHCLKCRNLLSLMIICSSVSAVTELVKSHLQDPNVKFYLCKFSHLFFVWFLYFKPYIRTRCCLLTLNFFLPHRHHTTEKNARQAQCNFVRSEWLACWSLLLYRPHFL